MFKKQMFWVSDKQVQSPIDVFAQLETSFKKRHFTNFGETTNRLQNVGRSVLEIDESKCVVACANASLALHVLVTAISMVQFEGKPMRLAAPAFTFPCNVQGVLHYYHKVKIVDIQPDTCTLDLSKVTPDDVDGIIVTNLFGLVADMEKYETWCTTHNKVLILDNAATPFARINTSSGVKNVNNFGIGSIVSLHHTKPIGFGEGGFVIADKVFEEMICRLINFGFTNFGSDTPRPFLPEANNNKMSDISAAFILSYWENEKEKSKTFENSEHFDGISKTLISHEEWVRSCVTELEKCAIPNVRIPKTYSHNFYWSTIPIIFENPQAIPPCEFINNVMIKKYYKPLESRPISDDVFSRILCFACDTTSGKQGITDVVEAIKKIAAEK